MMANVGPASETLANITPALVKYLISAVIWFNRNHYLEYNH